MDKMLMTSDFLTEWVNRFHLPIAKSYKTFSEIFLIKIDRGLAITILIAEMSLKCLKDYCFRST